MEYFDFEGASSAHESNHPSDDVASIDLEFDDAEERAVNFNSLLQDESLEFIHDPPAPETAEQNLPDAVGPDQDTGVYPMFRAEQPCDFCRRMGLDCFVAKRGVMQNGCTCCISLYRECSFTHAKVPGKFLQTLHPVSENAYIPTGGLTGKRALKSVSYGGFGDDSETRSRKNSTTRFSRNALNILKGWLRDNNNNPYPTETEKDELKNNTGLTRTQIANWLANARRRGKVRPASGPGSSAPGAVNIPGQDPTDLSLMTPIERWKHSPPENEPATIGDIARALANPPFDPTRQHRPSQSGHVRVHRPGSTNESSHASSDHKRYTASGSSLDSSHSSLSDLSFASAFSHRSSLSFGSMDRKERRRRRKASVPVNTFNHQKARAVRPFQCTFCTDSFAAKYDWQRHEKSMHLILDKWTCSPHGGVTEENGTLRCVFCFAINPDKDHLETHNYLNCQEKSIQERTFYRKDHLNQHLRLMHNAKFQPCMEIWQSSITSIKSRCGFCASVLHTWKDRVDHLAGHFKNGANMSQWHGDWGFEPYILERVENAIPPYMIDYEWRSPNPWTTVQAQGDGTTPRLSVPNDANCYDRLSHELTAYIHHQTAEGLIPTDQMIQAEARRVIYGCDDPWNQTCADNPVWLGILKRDTGLQSVVNNDRIQYSDLGLQPPFAVDGGLRNPPPETNILARAVCPGALPSPAVSSPGLRSPAYPGTGFSSAGPSGTGSLSGSYVGSAGMISAGVPAFSSDWGSSLPGNASASSAPAEGSADPLVQMGFDPEFLQRLNDSYSELTPPELEDLPLGDHSAYEGKGKEKWMDPSQRISDPIAILHSKEGGPPASDNTQQGRPSFYDNAGF
ncbi:hypothetical protein N7486_003330 [Penicillium sp. IBT 16267x]|nr:hypothetical protein N7486_003330 [Penicillium sp. IBT 16267x]